MCLFQVPHKHPVTADFIMSVFSLLSAPSVQSGNEAFDEYLLHKFEINKQYIFIVKK